MKVWTKLLTLILLSATARTAFAETRITTTARDEHGFLVHTIESPYQTGKTKVRVLLPDTLPEGTRHRVLYVLPADVGEKQRWGDGLLEVKRADLHNHHQVICVAPAFSHLPWYADHPTDATIRQESYFLKVVVPLIEREYPVLAAPEGRLLVGFSKSGWGAFSLLLRHAETFGKAAAWDAPLMKQRPNQFGMGPIFGTQENFEQYRLTSLLERHAAMLRDRSRLIHLGYGNFRDHHEQADALMDRLDIRRVFRDGPQRKHDWRSGWLPEAVDLLANETTPHWVWTDQKRDVAGQAFLHKEFVVAGEIQSANLRAVADFTQAMVFLNGQRVCELENYGPLARANVARQLKQGKNVLGVNARGTEGPSAVAVELEITFKDGSRRLIVSDSTWQASASEQRDWQPCATFGPVDFRYWHPRPQDVTIHEVDDYTQWKRALATTKGTDPASFQSPPGFEIELLSSAGKDEGSWVSLAFDPRGRVVIAREDQGLLRLTLPDGKGPIRVETINDTLKECRGLLFALGSLYVNANESKGLYRLRDTNGDDRFDEIKLLYRSGGGTGHGRNDLALGPDKMIYAIHGDAVDLPEANGRFTFATSPFAEHRRGAKTREGHVIRLDADGGRAEVVASGLRNPFGIDFNPDGEMFTYDADAEYDMGAPWYRPTRVNHLVRGGDYRWRGVTKSWPPYYPDAPDASPHNLNIGKGSPTAVKFGTNSRFPHRYRRALFALDWAYGRILAIHMLPRGASYLGRAETFVRGRPLNVTDLDFGPDGATYFVTGGRKTQSGLYRLRYVGRVEKDNELSPQQQARRQHAAQARALRRKLESLHGREDATAVEKAWPHSESPDPWIRHAARIAIEHQPIARWRQRALAESKPTAAVTALMSLARGDAKERLGEVLAKLNQTPLAELSPRQKLTALHTYSLCLERLEKLDAAQVAGITKQLAPLYPADTFPLNQVLSQLLVRLEAPDVVPKTLALLADTSVQRERLHYLLVLRDVKDGWSGERRPVYFSWLERMRSFRGGEGIPTFIKRVQADAVAALSAEEKTQLAPLIARLESGGNEKAQPIPKRPFVREWKLEDLLESLGEVGRGRDFKRGRRMFAAALCIRCHRMGNEGEVTGPDLTSAARRFSRRDLLVSILTPSAVVAEQYRASRVVTKDGRTLVGRIVPGRDYRSPKLRIETNPLDPAAIVEIAKQDIELHETARVSSMPQGLLNTLSREEILDLLAYLESGGRSDHPSFKP